MVVDRRLSRFLPIHVLQLDSLSATKKCPANQVRCDLLRQWIFERCLSDATKSAINTKNSPKRSVVRSTTTTSFVTDDDLIDEEQKKGNGEGEPNGNSEDLWDLIYLDSIATLIYN